MASIYQNLLVLGICWALVFSGGFYITFFDQPEEMERLEKAERVAQLKQAELASLMSEAMVTEDRSAEVVKRWKSRYKLIPKYVGSEEVIGFLNSLTKTGFKPFDISFKDHLEGASFNTYLFDITGRGYFRSVYNLIWELENSQTLYRISDLKLNHFDLITIDPETQRERLDVMVSFSFLLEAYYGGAAGLSATDDYDVEGVELGGDVPEPRADISQLPDGILPPRNPAINPFFPQILETIPPNTAGLLEIENSELISIVGDKAIFETDDGFESIGVGENIYLGQIISVDPRLGIVRARLNKGGIIDEIELVLDTGERYRQALGPVSLIPSTSN